MQMILRLNFLFELAAILEPANESLALCVGSSLIITCSSTTTTAPVLTWTITLIPGDPISTILVFYTNTSSLEDVKMISNFVLRLESTNPIVSTTTLEEVDPKQNGTVLTCMTFTPLGSVEFTQSTILIVKSK